MIRWFANNGVAANFLMLAIVFLGLRAAFTQIPLEIRPSVKYDLIWIEMSYRGATPEDVEETICIPIERALEAMPGVEHINSTASTGSAQIYIDPEEDTDVQKMLEEVQRRIDTISTFPNETERPRISIPNSMSKWEVASLIVFGDLNENELLNVTHQVKDDLLNLPGISQIQIDGNRRREISIEADPAVLRGYGLTLQDLTQVVRTSSIDLPGGSVRTAGGRVLLRTTSQAYTQSDFESITIRAKDGAEIRLGNVATVIDGFEGTRTLLRYNGKPALQLEVLRMGQESAIEISNALHDYVANAPQKLPSGVNVAVWDDDSFSLRGRLTTLTSSLVQGAILVLLVLGLFLRPMVAFWVVLGVPVAFAGGLMLMPKFDMTINLMSLFAFIIVIGIVVDDAIVTGENIFTKLREGLPPLEAAVVGTKEVATPVTFGVLTTIVAFMPLMFLDGFYGSFARQIPPIVAAVLLFSLVESKLILPAHLKHVRLHRNRRLNPISRFQKRIADSLELFVQRVYRPLLSLAARNRYATLSVFLAMALATIGLWTSGRLGFVTMPSIDRYRISANIGMPDDTPFELTDPIVQRVAKSAETLAEEFRDQGSGQSLIKAVMTTTTGGISGDGQSYGWVGVEILPPSLRTSRGPKNEVISKRWRELIGPVPEALSLRIKAESGQRGKFKKLDGLEIELRGPDSDQKMAAVEEIEALLYSYSDRIEWVWSNRGEQREELEIKLKPRAQDFGLSERDLATQLRTSFFGAEAQRIQRDREEIRVMVRTPESDRSGLLALQNTKISAPTGETIPFYHVASVEFVPAPTRIERIDGARNLEIFAGPIDSSVNIVELAEQIAPEINAIVSQVPDLSWRFDGYVAEHERTRRQSMFAWGALIIALYALLAIPFRSLLQPIIVLIAIPFGIIGALLGHLIMDITPSWLSVFGMLALAGVVVNDSLVMVDFANRRRDQGADPRDAILQSGVARFRPIILTSLTTFAGLAPLIFDRSLQAQFLIPMAVSLAFGILFATAITLLLIPCAYLVNEDLKAGFLAMWRWYLSGIERAEEPRHTITKEPTGSIEP